MHGLRYLALLSQICNYLIGAEVIQFCPVRENASLYKGFYYVILRQNESFKPITNATKTDIISISRKYKTFLYLEFRLDTRLHVCVAWCCSELNFNLVFLHKYDEVLIELIYVSHENSWRTMFSLVKVQPSKTVSP